MSECTTCSKPLTIDIDPEEEEDDYDQAVTSSEHEIPDSVELNCGCHFHWWVSQDQNGTVLRSRICDIEPSTDHE